MQREAFWLQNPLPIPMVYTSLFNAHRSYGKHEGVDLAATDSSGNPVSVLAAQSGLVVKVGYYASGYGHYIVIRHEWSDGNVYVSWYGHLSRSEVRAGDYVSVGEPIGVAGSSGNSTGVHLHLTLQHTGKGLTGYVVPDVVDPRPFFKNTQPVDKQLMFIADETIPDGISLQPGTAFAKSWRIANSGALDWQTGDQLAWIGGEKMGAPESVPLPVLKRGEQGLASIPMIAPHSQGRHISTWKARSSKGQFFEFPLWVDLLTAGSAPVDSALFLEDVSIPDGAVVSPGQTFLKSWRVRNTGSSDWRSGYQLVHSDDERMGAPESVPVAYTRAGEEAVISVSLQAPQASGVHRSTWRLRNPQGDFFGHEFYTLIQVPTVTLPAPDHRARFMGHETIDLWETLPPGQVFEKVWRVRNLGRTAWGNGYTLAYLDGEQMDGPESAPIPYAEKMMTVKIGVRLIAPHTPGAYRGYWKLRDPSGKLFGPRLPVWIRVV